MASHAAIRWFDQGDRSVSSTKQQVVLHPIMFALYPVAFLYSGNKALYAFSVTYAPAAVSVLFAGLVWFGLKQVLSDWNRAAIATSALLMATFSYSSVSQAAQGLAGGGGSDFWSKMIAACFVAVIAVVFFALRSGKHLGQVNYILNVVSIFLVAAPLFQAAIWNISMSSLASTLPDRTEFNLNPIPEGTTAGPDIYYFVLDGYASEEFLRQDYGLDISATVTALEQRGFTIADKAVANYPFTLASVNSSLNFIYLQDVLGDQLAGASGHQFLGDLMRDNRTVRLLKSVGYQVVSFEGEYWEANIGGVDVNLKEWWFLNVFNLGILQMTPLSAALDAVGYAALYEMHRIRTEYPFTHMRAAVDIPGPKFVYAHMYFGHPPFVFGENGERVSSAVGYTWNDGARLLDGDGIAQAAYREGYRAQVTYLNKRLLETVDEILANSEREPIIIMHGDHGPGARYDNEDLANTDVAERYSIFYAAHLPGGGNEDIYDAMTPVNGLRIVFNRYFGTNYDLLDDRSYFAAYSLPYHYIPVPELSEPDPEDSARTLPSDQSVIDEELLGSHQSTVGLKDSPGGD